MAKATPDNVKALGFTYEMVKDIAADESAFLSLIKDILEMNEGEVREALGSVYDDAAKVNDVKRVEAYLAAAELWDRAANIVLKNRQVSGGENALLNMTEKLLAEDYRARSSKIIDRLKGRSDFSISVGSSSHFPQDSE